MEEGDASKDGQGGEGRGEGEARGGHGEEGARSARPVRPGPLEKGLASATEGPWARGVCKGWAGGR
jgi:hypothetical protein